MKFRYTALKALTHIILNYTTKQEADEATILKTNLEKFKTVILIKILNITNTILQLLQSEQ